MTTSIYDIPVRMLDGKDTTLAPYRGKVLLIVNVASQCGFTPQYEGLEKLYSTYGDRGLVVLGFPSNQFGAQEPGTSEEIATFCEKNYGVTFPLFEKIDVNGADAHPLYELLKTEAPGILGTESIKWNFTKFVVDRNGKIVGRYASKDTPASLAPDLEKLLG